MPESLKNVMLERLRDARRLMKERRGQEDRQFGELIDKLDACIALQVAARPDLMELADLEYEIFGGCYAIGPILDDLGDVDE